MEGQTGVLSTWISNVSSEDIKEDRKRCCSRVICIIPQQYSRNQLKRHIMRHVRYGWVTIHHLLVHGGSSIGYMRVPRDILVVQYHIEDCIVIDSLILVWHKANHIEGRPYFTPSVSTLYGRGANGRAHR